MCTQNKQNIDEKKHIKYEQMFIFPTSPWNY